MTINELLVLAALSRGSAHGYVLMLRTGINAGSLYRTLRRLQEQNLIKVGPQHQRRKPYYLTVFGQRVLTEGLNRIADVLNGEPDSCRKESA